MNKEKLILVYYINLGNVSRPKSQLILEMISKNLTLEETHSIIIPIKDGDTKVECINPQLVSEEEYQSAKNVLERSQKALDDFLNSMNNKEESWTSVASCDRGLVVDINKTDQNNKPSFLQNLIGAFKNRKS